MSNGYATSRNGFIDKKTPPSIFGSDRCQTVSPPFPDNMLIRSEPSGLYCEKGDFYIDPSRAVDRAVITHAHSDHARKGSRSYLCSTACEPLLRSRLGKNISVQSMAYGATTQINGVKVSLHPAGHILGSSQVRVEYGGEVWAVSGDYKTNPDPTCTPFESVRCNNFISECTFGLPIYQWPAPDDEWQRMKRWWQNNRDHGLTSVVHAYSLGKAQRVLNALKDIEAPVLAHPSIMGMLPAYTSQGVSFPKVELADADRILTHKGKACVITPSTTAMEKSLGKPDEWEATDVSGWMQVKNSRRKRQLPSGFVISDHADWNGIIQAIKASNAEQVYLTHGDGTLLKDWLCQQGMSVALLHTGDGRSEDW